MFTGKQHLYTAKDCSSQFLCQHIIIFTRNTYLPPIEHHAILSKPIHYILPPFIALASGSPCIGLVASTVHITLHLLV
jgi:hypothetical protein